MPRDSTRSATRTAAKKSTGIRWRLWLSLALACAVCAFAIAVSIAVRDFVCRDPRFALSREHDDSLLVAGLQYASPEKVQEVFAGDFGRGIATVPLAERRRRLLAIDWVEDASVSRVWPDRLVVRVRERTPVAFVYLGNNVLLIDSTGALLEQPPQAAFAFPVLRGIGEDSSEDRRRECVRSFLRLEGDMGYLARDISEVDASDPENLRVVVQVDHQAVSLLLGDANYGRRYQNFLGHFQEIEQRLPGARTFDLRLEDRITAKE